MWAQLFQTRFVFSNHLWLEAAAILSDVGHDDDVVVDARLNFYLSESEKFEKQLEINVCWCSIVAVFSPNNFLLLSWKQVWSKEYECDASSDANYLSRHEVTSHCVDISPPAGALFDENSVVLEKEPYHFCYFAITLLFNLLLKFTSHTWTMLINQFA